MVPSDLNNFAREIMSHLADFADGTTGVDVLTLQDDDASASIKLQAPSAVTTTTTFTLPDGDGSNGQVLNTDGSGQLGWASAFSSGMLMPYAGGSAPSGWLLCYGQAISRTTYAALFSAIGTTYGTGDGSTTFNVPDLRGRVIAGQDDMGGTSADRLTNQSGGLDGDTLGATGGSETHTLTEDELAAHSHSLGTNGRVQVGNDNGEAYSGKWVSGSGSTITYSTEETGSDTAHNNVQPTIVLNYIIKT
jgi:microcystin-dependent protein